MSKSELYTVMGNRLRILRVNKQLSQNDLAGLLGCAQGQISAWELGKGRIPTNYLVEIAKMLECQLNDFDPRNELLVNVE